MTKREILSKHIQSTGADAYGLAIADGGRLSLAIIEKAGALDILEAVTGAVDTGKRTDAGARYNLTIGHTAIIRAHASKVYALPFGVADIEEAYKKSDRRGSNARNRGELFEDWTAEALSAERNRYRNTAGTTCGDLRIDGRDIQIKYDRGRL